MSQTERRVCHAIRKPLAMFIQIMPLSIFCVNLHFCYLYFMCQNKNVLDRLRNALNTFLKFCLTSASTSLQGFYTLCFHFYDTQRVSLISSKGVIMVIHYACITKRRYFPKTLVILKCKRRLILIFHCSGLIITK